MWGKGIDAIAEETQPSPGVTPMPEQPDLTDPHDPFHHRMVTQIANRWRGRLPIGLTWAEFLQEGELALAVARRNFDRDRGNRFSTFAYPSILRHLQGVVAAAAGAVRELPLSPSIMDRSRDFEAETIADLVWDEVDRLDPFAREAVIRRFGLDGYGEESQRSTAKSMGVDPRQIAAAVRRSLGSMRERLAGDVGPVICGENA